MKKKSLSEVFYLAAGVFGVAGLALTLSMVFAGAGIALLAIATFLLLASIIYQLGEGFFLRLGRRLSRPAKRERSTAAPETIS